MNEIQAVKTAKIEEVKKNSKKGFTLVELVVVIAILAILAAIAIPVVAGTIKSSQMSTARTNAQTIDLAIKEAQAMIESNDSTYGYTSTSTVSDIATKKAITSAFNAIKIDGHDYIPCWTESKVIFLWKDGATYKDVDGNTHAFATTGGKVSKVLVTITTPAGGGAATTTIATDKVVDLK